MYQPYSYPDSFQQLLEKHHRKIQKLEKELDELKQLVLQLQARPSVHVDRIEYKFDQLKVETLEGTMNVGLSPQDLQNMDQFAPGQFPTPSPITDPKKITLQNHVKENMKKYVGESVPQIISDTQQQLGLAPDSSYDDFINQDIENQLETRIVYHIEQLAPQVLQKEPLEQVAEMVSARIKGEIQQGIFSFLSRFQTNEKGETDRNGV